MRAISDRSESAHSVVAAEFAERSPENLKTERMGKTIQYVEDILYPRRGVGVAPDFPPDFGPHGTSP